MTTEPARPTLPPTIRNVAQSLSPSERERQRTWIAERVETLLENYWQSRPDERVRGLVLGDWIALLEPFAAAEIRDACREWLRDCPRLKPRPGDIVALIQRDRGKAAADWQRASARPEPARPERVSAERAAEILADAGFRPRRMVEG